PGDGLLRVATTTDQRDHPAAVLSFADDFAARDERKLGRSEGGVLGVVGVGEVPAGGFNFNEQRALGRDGLVELNEFQYFRCAGFSNLDFFHALSLPVAAACLLRRRAAWRGPARRGAV